LRGFLETGSDRVDGMPGEEPEAAPVEERGRP
jgi:hypothetical protein